VCHAQHSPGGVVLAVEFVQPPGTQHSVTEVVTYRLCNLWTFFCISKVAFKPAANASDKDYCDRCFRRLSVCESVRLYVTRVHCARTAERIKILFGVKTFGDPRNIILDCDKKIRCGLRQITLATCLFLVLFYVLSSLTNMHIICAVVVYCHPHPWVTARFLFYAQDHNMTNGDFAFFTFDRRRGPVDAKPSINALDEFVDNPDDLPKRRRVFSVIKQVANFFRVLFPFFDCLIFSGLWCYKLRHVSFQWTTNYNNLLIIKNIEKIKTTDETEPTQFFLFNNNLIYIM